ncbi:gas vesicle protein [Streptomyces sp. NPDC059881]|uniref:gas vesicle protein n=1 Tax=Streptomyces sp. NPDC059881 TaxID=3346986 RepID=UPI00365BBCB4
MTAPTENGPGTRRHGTGPEPRTQSLSPALAERRLALVDLLDRLLAGGVVIKGDVTLRIADVDLVRVDLNALICSVGPAVASPFASFGAFGASESPAYSSECFGFADSAEPSSASASGQVTT